MAGRDIPVVWPTSVARPPTATTKTVKITTLCPLSVENSHGRSVPVAVVATDHTVSYGHDGRLPPIGFSVHPVYTRKWRLCGTCIRSERKTNVYHILNNIKTY